MSLKNSQRLFSDIYILYQIFFCLSLHVLYLRRVKHCSMYFRHFWCCAILRCFLKSLIGILDYKKYCFMYQTLKHTRTVWGTFTCTSKHTCKFHFRGGIVSKIQLSVLGANYVSYMLLSMLIEISCRWFGVEPRTG